MVVSAATATVVALTLGVFRRSLSSATLAACAVALLLGNLSPLTEGTPGTRTLGLAALPLVIPLAALSLTPRHTALGWLVAVGGLLAGPVRALRYDPLRDRECRGCLHTSLVVHPDVAAAAHLALLGGILVAVGLAILTMKTRQPFLLALTVGAALSVTGFREPSGVSSSAPLVATWVAAAAGALAIAGVVTSRRRLRLLAQGLAGDPTDAVRRALGDPDLQLVFRLADGWVDADGNPVQAPSKTQETRVKSNGELLALLAHTSRLDDPLSPELILCLANARLGAQLAAQERDLSSARTRLVERADREARLLERDLHDGAQQHLLALAIDLRVALESASGADRDRLEEGLALIATSLDDLREISHGIFPPLLGAAGLGPALSALARYADVGLSVTTVPPARLPDLTERTAYLVVLDTLLRATAAVVLAAQLADGMLVLELDCSPPPADSLLYDRVAAAGGTLTAETDRMVVRIPCG